MSSNNKYFSDENLHLMDFATSKGQNLKGTTDIVQVNPDSTSTPAFDSIVKYKIRAHGDKYLNKSALVCVIGALSGSGGTYIRGVNALGVFMWSRFELWQHSKHKGTIYADDIFNNILYHCDADEFALISQQIGYDTSTSNRNTLGASAQTFVLPLQRLFNVFSKPLDRSLLKDEFEIHGYLRSGVRYVIQTDKTSPTFSITNTYLDLEYLEPKSKIVNAVRQNYIDRNHVSDAWFDVEHTQVIQTLLSGATTATINLPELQDKDVIDIQVVLRASTLLNTNDASDYTDTYIACTSWNLKSNAMYLNGVQQDITTAYYNKVVFPRLKFVGSKNLISSTTLRSEFVIPFGHNAKEEHVDKKAYHGSRYFKENDCKLTLNFGSLAANTDCFVLIRSAKRQCISRGEIVNC